MIGPSAQRELAARWSTCRLASRVGGPIDPCSLPDRTRLCFKDRDIQYQDSRAPLRRWFRWNRARIASIIGPVACAFELTRSDSFRSLSVVRSLHVFYHRAASISSVYCFSQQHRRWATRSDRLSFWLTKAILVATRTPLCCGRCT